MTRRSLMAMVAAVLLLATGPAWAKHVRYAGAHPVSLQHGGGYCYVQVPHVHGYTPDRAALYQEDAEGAFVFTGDPTPFGYEGPKHTFYGHHPVPAGTSHTPVYCFLDGPHSHDYQPPDLPEYRVKGGVAFFVGPFAPGYFRDKPRKVKLVEAEYRPYPVTRPVVEVTPPPEWRGDPWMPPPPPSVVVNPPPLPGPPTVTVNPPPPRGVVVTAPPPPTVMVAAPPLPSPVVVVHPPTPRPVLVVAPPPRHVVVAPAPRGVVVVHERDWEYGHRGKVKWKHDNGKHRGGGKHR